MVYIMTDRSYSFNETNKKEIRQNKFRAVFFKVSFFFLTHTVYNHSVTLILYSDTPCIQPLHLSLPLFWHTLYTATPSLFSFILTHPVQNHSVSLLLFWHTLYTTTPSLSSFILTHPVYNHSVSLLLYSDSPCIQPLRHSPPLFWHTLYTTTPIQPLLLPLF